MRTVSAAQANREFSKLLQAVRGGETVLITSRGEPVATLAPPAEVFEQMSKAKAELLARLQTVQPMNLAKWTRDELYED
jgi:prevent-host-death family protein